MNSFPQLDGTGPEVAWVEAAFGRPLRPDEKIEPPKEDPIVKAARDYLRKSNPYHEPAGSPEGGRFTSADSVGGGGGDKSEKPATMSTLPTRQQVDAAWGKAADATDSAGRPYFSTVTKAAQYLAANYPHAGDTPLAVNSVSEIDTHPLGTNPRDWNVSPELFSRAAHTVLQLGADYPQVAMRMTSFSVDAFWDHPNDQAEGVLAETKRANPSSGDPLDSHQDDQQILLRQHIVALPGVAYSGAGNIGALMPRDADGRASKLTTIDEVCANDVAKGFHVPGADNLESVITHEFGHLWQARGFDTADLAASVEFKQVQRGEDKAPSGYAERNYKEWWAESFTSAHVTPTEQQIPDVRAIATWLTAERSLQREGRGNFGSGNTDMPRWIFNEGWEPHGWATVPSTTKKAAQPSANATVPYHCPLMDDLVREMEAMDREKASREDPVVKAAKAYLRKYNENHDEQGRFASADAEGGNEGQSSGVEVYDFARRVKAKFGTTADVGKASFLLPDGTLLAREGPGNDPSTRVHYEHTDIVDTAYGDRPESQRPNVNEIMQAGAVRLNARWGGWIDAEMGMKPLTPPQMKVLREAEGEGSTESNTPRFVLQVSRPYEKVNEGYRAAYIGSSDAETVKPIHQILREANEAASGKIHKGSDPIIQAARAYLQKSNPNHEPAGSPEGGRFASADEGGSGSGRSQGAPDFAWASNPKDSSVVEGYKFTVNGPRPPKLIGAARAELGALKTTDAERSIVITPDGRVLKNSEQGNATEGQLTSEQEANLRGATLIHNHPLAEGGMAELSANDLALAARNQMKAVEAVTPGGMVYRAEAGPKGWPKDSDIMSYWGEGKATIRATAAKMSPGLADIYAEGATDQLIQRLPAHFRDTGQMITQKIPPPAKSIRIKGAAADPIVKAAKTYLRKYNENHDEQGRFASADSSGGSTDATTGTKGEIVSTSVGPLERPPQVAPGETPVPAGMVRGYHYTRTLDDLHGVRTEGLQLSHALGTSYGEPNAIWFSTTKPDDSQNYVEVHLDPHELLVGSPVSLSDPNDKIDQAELDGFNESGHNFTVKGNTVGPERIVSYHEPWHDTYRYWTERYPQKNAGGEASIATVRDSLKIGGDYTKAGALWLADAEKVKKGAKAEDPIVKAAKAYLRKEYDENQPRDENGRWASSGDGTASTTGEARLPIFDPATEAAKLVRNPPETAQTLREWQQVRQAEVRSRTAAILAKAPPLEGPPGWIEKATAYRAADVARFQDAVVGKNASPILDNYGQKMVQDAFQAWRWMHQPEGMLNPGEAVVGLDYLTRQYTNGAPPTLYYPNQPTGAYAQDPRALDLYGKIRDAEARLAISSYEKLALLGVSRKVAERQTKDANDNYWRLSAAYSQYTDPQRGGETLPAFGPVSFASPMEGSHEKVDAAWDEATHGSGSFATAKEALDYLSKAYPLDDGLPLHTRISPEVKVEDLDPALVSRSAHTLLRLAADYPVAAANLHLVTIKDPNDTYNDTPTGASVWKPNYQGVLAETQSSSGPSADGTSYINLLTPIVSRDYGTDAQVAGVAAKGWFAPGAAGIEYLTAHEFGHVLYFSPETREALQVASAKNYNEVLPRDQTPDAPSELAPSGYAKKNSSEWWAETFASSIFTPHALQNQDTQTLAAELRAISAVERSAAKLERAARAVTRNARTSVAAEDYHCSLMNDFIIWHDEAEREKRRRLAEDPIVKAAKAYLRKYNENHDERGRFASADSSGGAGHPYLEGTPFAEDDSAERLANRRVQSRAEQRAAREDALRPEVLVPKPVPPHDWSTGKTRAEVDAAWEQATKGKGTFPTLRAAADYFVANYPHNFSEREYGAGQVEHPVEVDLHGFTGIRFVSKGTGEELWRVGSMAKGEWLPRAEVEAREEKRISPVLFSQSLHTLLQLAADYPQVADRLAKVSIDMDPSRAGQKQGEIAEAMTRNFKGMGTGQNDLQEIFIRARVIGTRLNINEIEARPHDDVVGAHGIEPVLTHEFGHLFHADTYDTVSQMAKVDYAEARTERAASPSNYATHSPDEWWAEAFKSAYVTPPEQQVPAVRQVAAWLETERTLQREGRGNFTPPGHSVGNQHVWLNEGTYEERGWRKGESQVVKAAGGKDMVSSFDCPYMDDLDRQIAALEEAEEMKDTTDPVIKVARDWLAAHPVTLRKYDEDQPRDENHQKWAKEGDGGGGKTAETPAPKSAPTKETDTLAPQERSEPRNPPREVNLDAFRQSIVDAINSTTDTGATLDVKTGVSATQGYVVALEGRTKMFSAEEMYKFHEDPTAVAAALKTWVDDNQDQLGKTGWIGIWKNSANNTLYWDVVQNLAHKEDAVALGVKRNQVSVFDVVKGEEIPTNGDGKNRGRKTTL